MNGRYTLDEPALRRGADRAAARYEEGVAAEISRRMAERLDYVKLAPRRVLDLGCGTGRDLLALADRYPRAERVGVDRSLPMLARARAQRPWYLRMLPGGARLVCARAERLPLAPGSVGLAWSNLLALSYADPLPLFAEVLRVMEVGGLFMFSTLGPDTLKELRAAFAAADDAPHVHRFIDMHDLGDMLVSCGFAGPVMDMEVLTLTYPGLDTLLAELRASGATNAETARRRSLTGRRRWQRVREAYEAQRRDGRLPVTLEVVYGHAWKPEPRVSADGRAIVKVQRRPR